MTLMLCGNCGISQLDPFAKQNSFLKSILGAFIENVDPLEDRFVDALITRDVFKPHFHEAVKHAGPTRVDRARKLWQLLTRVPPSVFFKKVEPLLKEYYSDTVLKFSQPSTTEKEKMCLRDVVEIVLPLKQMADNLLSKQCIDTRDHRDLTKGEMIKRRRWKQFFDTMKAMKTKSRAAGTMIFENYLVNHEIPKPDDLLDLLSQGFPCVCSAPATGEVMNKDRMCRECREEQGAKTRAEKAAKLGTPITTVEDKWLREPEDWYPAVRPPVNRKKDIFRPDRFKHVDDTAKAAPRELRTNFGELVAYLTRGLTTDLEKLRAVFTWMGAQKIASQPDVDSNPEHDSPEAYIREASKNNAYISTLFAVLCRKVGLPCIIVNGTSKCSGYAAGDQTVPYQTSWTIVHVDGQWRIVHPQWAFECLVDSSKGTWILVEQDGTSKREKTEEKEGRREDTFVEHWFIPNPEEFNTICHTENPAHQLLHSPWSMSDFLKTPFLKPDYYDSPWQLLNAYGCVLAPLHGTCCMDFQHPPEGRAELRYMLYYNEELSGQPFPEDKQISLYVTRLKERHGIKSLLIRLPVVGVYKISVNGVYDAKFYYLGEFRIQCKVPAAPHPFPANPAIGFGFDETVSEAGLTNPSHTYGVVLVRPHQEVNFKFNIGKGKGLRTTLRHHKLTAEELANNVSLSRNGGTATIRVALPTDESTTEYALLIDVGNEATLDNFVNALNYMLTTDQDAYDASRDESKEIHKELFAALCDDDASKLEKAVARYHRAGFNEPQTIAQIRAKQAVYEDLRAELLAAIQSRSIERIDHALNQFLAHNLEGRENIHKAVQRICSLGEAVVRQAMSTRAVDHLGPAMARVTSTQAKDEVRQTAWFQEAEQLMKQLQCYSLCSRALTATALLALGRMPVNNDLLNVMKATYFLLGESPRTLQNWVGVKAKLAMREEKGLGYRIKHFDKTQLLMTHVAHAKEALRVCDPDVARSLSDLAGLLYDWCIQQINDFERSM